MAFGDEDVASLYEDFGVEVVAGDERGNAHLDIEGDLNNLEGQFKQGFIQEEITINFPATVLTKMKQGDLITVDGTKYTVRSPIRKLGDGAVKVAELKKA
jgi:hypothetical protein